MNTRNNNGEALGLVGRERNRAGKFRDGCEGSHLFRMASLSLRPHAAKRDTLLSQSLIRIVGA